jgi:hypothetical protein
MKQKQTINACLMPTEALPREKEIYAKILETHCDQKGDGHECRGKVSITRTTLTLSCPLCGDSRKTL